MSTSLVERDPGPVVAVHDRVTDTRDRPTLHPSLPAARARADLQRWDAGELVRMVADGDEGAWGELVERFGGLVWRVARRHGLSPQDAADVSQTTWLLLFQHVGQLRDPNRVASWLATTAGRESLRVSISTSRRRPGRSEAEIEQLREPGADADLLSAERQELVQQALDQLPPRCQQLLRLLIDDRELSYAEVGEQLGMPIGSIGPTRARCLKCLRDSRRLATLRLNAS